MEELERFMPGLPGEIWYEHWHRYHFVAPLADGKRVLDIACGEGYGSALLATRAAHVTGVDVSTEIIAHARRRYGAAPNLEYVEGRCEAIPAADASIDLLVSFETLEHIPAPEKLADEAKRVVKADGLFVVSTPNKEIYTDRLGYRNPHHLRELYRGEFVEMMRARFPEVALLGQRVDAYSAIFPMEATPTQAQLLEAGGAAPEAPASGVSEPMYFVAVCGRSAAAVGDCARRFSLFSDRDHWVYEDYRSVNRKFKDLEQHAARIEAAYHAAQRQIAVLSQERDELLARARPQTQPAAPPGWRKR